MKSGRLVIIGLALLLFGYLFLHSNAYGVWTRGLGYMNNSPDKYELSYHEIPGEYSLEIDLNDLDNNVGKRIWQDGEQYIEVYLVDEREPKFGGGYRIFFQSHGIYNLQEGTLTTGIKHLRFDLNIGGYDMQAKLSTTYNGKIYDCNVQGMSGINEKDGDTFGFYVFPSKAYREDNVPLENAGIVTVTISNLIEHRWVKIK